MVQKKKVTTPKRANPKDSAVAHATLRHVRISPRKLRLVVNLVKGKHVEEALKILRFNPRKGSRITEKVLQSAIANARETKGADVDRLWVTGGFVNMGRTLKRHMPQAQGRATPVEKKSAHLTILLGEK